MRFVKGIKILVCVVLASVVFGFALKYLWNWLMPGLFGLHTISYWQAIGLFVLSKILFGGIHKHGGRGGRGRKWKQHMEARWQQMSAEEREKFRAGMRGRHGCGWTREDKERFRNEVRSRWGRDGEVSSKETI